MLIKAAFIWSKYSKNSNTMKYDFYCNIILKYNFAYSCDVEAEFSADITWVFSVTWSFRNHSTILICCSRDISFQCWKQFTCFICKLVWPFCLQNWWIYLKYCVTLFIHYILNICLNMSVKFKSFQANWKILLNTDLRLRIPAFWFLIL